MSCPITFVGKYFFLPAWTLIKPLFRKLIRLKVYGIENIPEGPCIVASNHRSHLDPPVLNSVFKEPLVFLAKEELFKPPLGCALKHMRAIPLKRGSSDVEVLEYTLELLHSGCKVCIFPEGTRAKPGEFLRPKPGVGLLAIKSGYPVLPVYIEGTDKIFPRGKKFPNFLAGSVKVVIGKPKRYDHYEANIRNYKRVSQEIMEEIKKLSSLYK